VTEKKPGLVVVQWCTAGTHNGRAGRAADGQAMYVGICGEDGDGNMRGQTGTGKQSEVVLAARGRRASVYLPI